MNGQRRNHEVDERAEESPPQKQEKDEEEEDVCWVLNSWHPSQRHLPHVRRSMLSACMEYKEVPDMREGAPPL